MLFRIICCLVIDCKLRRVVRRRQKVVCHYVVLKELLSFYFGFINHTQSWIEAWVLGSATHGMGVDLMSDMILLGSVACRGSWGGADEAAVALGIHLCGGKHTTND